MRPAPPSDADREAVAELLGREPRGSWKVVVRGSDGGPVVIWTAPHLEDGTPMPTSYWLVGRSEREDVSRLEAAGGVKAAEAAVDPALLASAHEAYGAERSEHLEDAPGRPAPSGGVGGTRKGVKCLHAHLAWHLAGGDDPVGRWTAAELGISTDSYRVEP